MTRTISALTLACGLALAAGPTLAGNGLTQDMSGANRRGPAEAVQDKAPAPGPGTSADQPIGGREAAPGMPAMGGDASDAIGNPGSSDSSGFGDTPANPDERPLGSAPTHQRPWDDDSGTGAGGSGDSGAPMPYYGGSGGGSL